MHRKKSVFDRLRASHTLRTVVSVLFVLNTVLLVACAQCFAFLRQNDFYTTGGEALRERVTDQLMQSSSREAMLYFQNYLMDIFSQNPQSESLAQYEQMFSEKNSNYFFSFWINGENWFRNYTAESGRSYYPKAADFFSGGEINSLIPKATRLSFEGHLKKTLTADDVYLHVAVFFRLADSVKYAVFALLMLACALEIVWSVLVCVGSGRTGTTETVRLRDIDRIPMYFLFPFFGAFAVVCGFFLLRQTEVLGDVYGWFSGADWRPAAYAYFLLLIILSFLIYTMLTTVSVRLKTPDWWHRSILYRTFAARSLGQRVRTVLTILTAAEFLLFLVVFQIFHKLPAWVYLLCDAAFTVALTLLLSIVAKDMDVYIPAARRIVEEKHGYIPTDALSASGRQHAENINFLSRSASAHTEKRYINENFSTRLIHNVSHGLREPLNAVAENVRLLERGGLNAQQEAAHVREIYALSQELKKTIEDLIRISKATTGNLPFEPTATDAGMMLSQAVGEFYEKFDEAGVSPVTEQPEHPVLMLADEQYMWYVFEGVLSVMLANAVRGTRLFLSASGTGGKAILRFRCTVRPDAQRQLHELSGMGLSIAKAFTILQGGTMYDKLRQDTLTAVLQFPRAADE